MLQSSREVKSPRTGRLLVRKVPSSRFNWLRAAGLLATVVLGCLGASAAHALVEVPDRPWRVVILNDADPTLPAFVAMDRAMQAALTAPGRHQVDTFFESLDSLRFPTAQLEEELVALLAKKYIRMRVDAVVAIGTASLDFVEKHYSRLWPD